MNQYIEVTSEPPKPNDGVVNLSGLPGLITSAENNTFTVSIDAAYFRNDFEKVLTNWGIERFFCESDFQDVVNDLCHSLNHVTSRKL